MVTLPVYRLLPPPKKTTNLSKMFLWPPMDVDDVVLFPDMWGHFLHMDEILPKNTKMYLCWGPKVTCCHAATIWDAGKMEAARNGGGRFDLQIFKHCCLETSNQILLGVRHPSSIFFKFKLRASLPSTLNRNMFFDSGYPLQMVILPPPLTVQLPFWPSTKPPQNTWKHKLTKKKLDSGK